MKIKGFVLLYVVFRPDGGTRSGGGGGDGGGVLTDEKDFELKGFTNFSHRISTPENSSCIRLL